MDDRRLGRRAFLGAAVTAAAGLVGAGSRTSRAGEAFHRTTDVVVIGFGAAGACAAVEARAAGADVLIVERAETGGGTSALAGGILYFGGGTALQRDLGYEDSVEDMFRYLMASSGPQPDEAKVRLFCERSVEHFDWIRARGVPFRTSFYKGISLPLTDDGLLYSGSELAHPFRDLARPAPRGHKVRALGGEGGALLMTKLIEAARRSGAAVTTGARCRSLLQEADGSVVGVELQTGDGVRSVRARRGVVVCAGGFCRNRDMVARFAPRYLDCDTPIGVAGDDGAGILMGMAAGGAAVRMDAGFSALPFHPPEKLIEGILVNAAGARFVNEDVYYGLAGEEIVRRQGGRAFLILDRDCSVDSAYARPRLVAEGSDAAELERAAGFADGALVATLELYNRHARDGRDPVFHKQARYLRPLDRAPLRILECSTDKAYYPFFTLGGLHTTTGGEVLDPFGSAVPGLYAAGRTTSGVSALGYSSGVSLSDATFFGRLAGRSAARRGAAS